MKVNDFKLLATLPEEYDYEIFPQGDHQLIIGKKHATIVGFLLVNEKLHSVKFDERTQDERNDDDKK